MDNFENIIDEHLTLLRNVVGAIVLNHHDVDEIIQNTFIKAYRNFDQLDNKNIKWWLLKVARNEAYDYCRAAKRKNKLFQSSTVINNEEQSLDLTNTIAGSSLHDQYLVQEELTLALKSIKDEYREALLLTAVEGLNGDDACACLNISKTLLHWRIHKARVALKKELKKLNNSSQNYQAEGNLQLCGGD
ncbi:RNA polymerase sigma factor [Lentisphaerota bacterium WC36G]|nr:RNA polymerase sigma factor [Lentisphaerae bacterium WC36]